MGTMPHDGRLYVMRRAVHSREPGRDVQPTGKLYHRYCLGEAFNAWFDYQQSPAWKRLLVRFLMRRK
jgi:hypothetical protein